MVCFTLSQPMSGPVLQTLSDTLVADALESKSSTDKPKVRSSEEASVFPCHWCLVDSVKAPRKIFDYNRRYINID